MAAGWKDRTLLGYAEPDAREGTPTPPLHFWVRLILFAAVAAALAWPLLIKS